MNIDKLNQEFEEIQKGEVKEAETEDFIEIALREGKKIAPGQ